MPFNNAYGSNNFYYQIKKQQQLEDGVWHPYILRLVSD